jgi:hypothetical protein
VTWGLPRAIIDRARIATPQDLLLIPNPDYPATTGLRCQGGDIGSGVDDEPRQRLRIGNDDGPDLWGIFAGGTHPGLYLWVGVTRESRLSPWLIWLRAE